MRRSTDQESDLWNPADFEAFVAPGGHADKCPSVTGVAARLATEVLIEAEGHDG